ncbi:MAG: hypothetical protein QG622_2832 [Actinomycetota bacterium]|nr:hypothetical protein [Actinomycetota bacterium]
MSEASSAFVRSVRDEAKRRSEWAGRVVREVEERRVAAEEAGYNFTGVTSEQLWGKLARTNSPFVTTQGWTSSSSSPGLIDYTMGITNPDQTTAYAVFAHVFVGPAGVAQTVDGALAAVDTRFPRLTEPAFDGLVIGAGESTTLHFMLEIPADLQASNYLGNAVLFTTVWNDPATYLDRSLFIFSVG